MTLQEFFQQHPHCALAFSGGTDSALLLYAMKKYGCHGKAYFVHGPFQPAFEAEDAKRLARELQVDLEVIPVDILQNEEVRRNPVNRCYFCKRLVFAAILNHARKDGYTEILDGTNASDETSDRPGMRALQELSILSPLRLCGLTKTDVRALSRQAGLFTWNKPSYACLATRIPAGKEICLQDLHRVEEAEQLLRERGYYNFRVRMYRNGKDIATLQFEKGQRQKARQELTLLERLLRPWFSGIVLDSDLRKEESLPADEKGLL